VILAGHGPVRIAASAKDEYRLTAIQRERDVDPVMGHAAAGMKGTFTVK
jgi:hypothetical protein